MFGSSKQFQVSGLRPRASRCGRRGEQLKSCAKVRVLFVDLLHGTSPEVGFRLKNAHSKPKAMLGAQGRSTDPTHSEQLTLSQYPKHLLKAAWGALLLESSSPDL